MSNFYSEIIRETGAEEPVKVKDIDLKKEDLSTLKIISGPGVYQMIGYRSDNPKQEEEVLYVGKNKKITTNVGDRAYNQLNDQQSTFRTNIKKENYKFCSSEEAYDWYCKQNSQEAICVTKVKICVFDSTEKGFHGRDLTEILLINSYDYIPIFNKDFSYISVQQRSEEDEQEMLDHQHRSELSDDEIKEERWSTGTLTELFPDEE